MQKPLLEHLIELRIRLIYSLLALIASMAVCYPFAPPLFQFLTAPLWHAMGEEEGRRMIYTGLTEAFLTYLKVTFFAGFVAFLTGFLVIFLVLALLFLATIFFLAAMLFIIIKI